MGRSDLRRLRQQDGDAVTTSDALGTQRIGKRGRGLPEPTETLLLHLPVGPNIENGEALRVDASPAVAHIGADVVALRYLPSKPAVKLVVVADVGKHDVPYRRGSRSAPALLRSGKDQCPEYLVFGRGRIGGRDSHPGRILEQHVGAVRRRVAPSGKSLV